MGHSPNLNTPIASPADVTLTEDEKHTMYTLKQLKRMLFIHLWKQIIILTSWNIVINPMLLTDMSKLERIALFRKAMKHIVNFYNYAWLFLEIHMQKIIFISFILLCLNDVSKVIVISI